MSKGTSSKVHGLRDQDTGPRNGPTCMDVEFTTRAVFFAALRKESFQMKLLKEITQEKVLILA